MTVLRLVPTFLALVALLALPHAAHAQGVPGVDKNKCLAAKTACVAKKVAGLFKCREKCQKSPEKCGQDQADCEAKVIEKFEGSERTKSCFEKAEDKWKEGKADTVCTTVGDEARLEAKVDDAVADMLNDLEAGDCPATPPSPNDACSAPNGTSCFYGEECCCRECFKSYGCICNNGTFQCFFTDACLGADLLGCP